jgi:hypothetical protein
MKRSAPLLAGIFATFACGQTGAIGTWSVQVNAPAIQINARVPSVVTPCDHVTLAVMVGNVASPVGVTIAVQ